MYPLLVCFCSVTGSFGHTMGTLGGLFLTKTMNHGATDVLPRYMCDKKVQSGTKIIPGEINWALACILVKSIKPNMPYMPPKFTKGVWLGKLGQKPAY